jgi:hypothetical protein
LGDRAVKPFDERAPQRAIVGFDRDEEGHWVALLECGHRQHVRHAPPMQRREWVLTDEGRRSQIGTTLACMHCLSVDS